MALEDAQEELRKRWPLEDRLDYDDMMESVFEYADYAAVWGLGNVTLALNKEKLSANYQLREDKYILTHVAELTEEEKQRIRDLCP